METQVWATRPRRDHAAWSNMKWSAVGLHLEASTGEIRSYMTRLGFDGRVECEGSTLNS